MFLSESFPVEFKRISHVSLSARMLPSPRGRVRAPRARGDHGMELTPKCWEREKMKGGRPKGLSGKAAPNGSGGRICISP
jgi:hypothetical protein